MISPSRDSSGNADALALDSDHLAALVQFASLGMMTKALLHDLASTVQGIQCALEEIQYEAADRIGDLPDVVEGFETCTSLSHRMIELFRAANSFMGSSRINGGSCHASEVVHLAQSVCYPYVRHRATLRIGDIPDVAITASRSSVVQVLVDLLRSAADASPSGGTIDLEVCEREHEVCFRVTDDGAGGAPQLGFGETDAHQMSLSTSAAILASEGGSIYYRLAPERGAELEVRVSKSPQA
jgi:C4-dicarboxylate-specific signal transduction histidine kinase